ncbi:right-handed parallel beta-helix repeat-containing protein [Anatilimnocola floriformis]|uniref:right-handed parallel beta-helix repeat-containing protein n=1 Tax=Anatilimnocola floriformis TaxID=2948575 RepID=UPI0020C2F61B|nr:right-handed parallel beta-helix repeat-containing protein [Anatilimnocola floriformis]
MTQRRFQSPFALLVILLTPCAELTAQPAADKLSATGTAAEGAKAVIPANLFVDDDNTGAQDGSALRPYRTVQQAIDAAKDNSVIAVAGGIYSANIRVQEKTVRLYGGYIGGTKADYAGGTGGNFKARDPAAHSSHLKGNGKDSVVTLYEAGASVVDGFLITGGGPSSVAAPSRLGGGFYVYQGTPTISHNVIEKNQTCPPTKPDEEARGGGIYASGSGVSLTILNNTIRNNVSGRGAGIFSDGPKLVIRGNKILNNIGVGDHGGGAFLNSPNAEISNNRIEGNEIARLLGYGWGGGMIVVNTGSHYKLSRNVFAGNYAPSLGAGFFADEGATASMEHDLVYGNKTKPDGEGAAVYVDGNEDGTSSTLTLNHVTIADHTSTPMAKGNAVKATWNSKLVVKNSILWNNGGDDVEADEKSKAAVTYTLSQETIKGTGNLSKDPLFVNAAGQDYRLRPGSPAINAAEAAANGARANLGADEKSTPASEDNGVKQTTPVVQPKQAEKPQAETDKKTSNTYLLRGTEGELPSEVGDDTTKLTKVESPELGGAAVQIDVIDTFGQKVSRVADWTPFETLRLDIINKSAKEFSIEFNLFHSETKAFATRVVAPFVLKPGKNEVRISVPGLKNTNGSPAKLSEVRRWYVASETPVRLLVGDIYLEGEGGGTSAYTIKTDPARLERIKSTKMPAIAKPIPYNTPEADAIMSAAEIFPANNPWNTLVEDWPVHRNSAAMIASVGAAKPLRYNQDMAFVIVPLAQKKVDVKLILGPDESDAGPYPVADNTPIEGWPASFQQDPLLKNLTLNDVQRGKPDLEQDRHGIVFDPVGRKVYEFYRLTKTDAGWHADGAAIFDLASNKLRPDGWTSSDAAGLPILPAIVRYDEIQRGVIDHALRFTVTRSRRAYVYPATHFASKLTDENLPRMGERFRLRKDFDTSKFSPEARVILEALKRYGMFMADNGMDWGLSVSGDERLPVFHEELRRVKGSDFEVVTPPPGYTAP